MASSMEIFLPPFPITTANSPSKSTLSDKIGLITASLWPTWLSANRVKIVGYWTSGLSVSFLCFS